MGAARRATTTWQLVCAGAAGVVACALTWWYTSVGLFMTPDSGSYLGVVHNLRSGAGLTSAIPPETATMGLSEQLAHFGRFPLTEWPPLFPVAVWVAGWTGLEPVGAARAVNVVSTAMLVVVIAWAIARLVDPHPLVLLVAPIAVLLAPVQQIDDPLLVVDSIGPPGLLLSESLFLPVFLLAIVVGSAAGPATRRRWMVGGVVLVAVATMIRFAGMAAGFGAGAAVISAGPVRGLRARWWRATALAASGPVAVVLWGLVRSAVWGGEGDQVAWHPPGMTAVGDYIDVTSGWFAMPGTWPDWVRGLVVLAIFIWMTTVVAVPAVRRVVVGDAFVSGQVPGDLARGIAAALWASFGVLVATQTLLDANVATTQRLLAPMQILTWILLLAIIAVVAPRLAAALGAGSVARQVIGGAVLGVLSVLVIVGSLRTIDDRRDLLAAAVQMQQESTDASPLGSLPADTVVVANFTGRAFLETGRPALLLPPAVDPITEAPSPDFESEMKELGRLFERQPGVVVLTPGVGPFDPRVLEGLDGGAGLTVRLDCENGEVLLTRPSSDSVLDGIAC